MGESEMKNKQEETLEEHDKHCGCGDSHTNKQEDDLKKKTRGKTKKYSIDYNFIYKNMSIDEIKKQVEIAFKKGQENAFQEVLDMMQKEFTSYSAVIKFLEEKVK